MKRSAAVVCAGAVLLAILLWIPSIPAGVSNSVPPAAGNGAPQAVVGELEGEAGTTGKAPAAPVDRVAVAVDPGSCRLVVKLVDAAGAAATGTVAWTATPGPPRTLPSNSDIGRAMAKSERMEPGSAIEADQGVVAIGRTRSAWTWVRVDARGCSGPIYFLAPPAAGEVVRQVRVPPEQGHVHVLALTADLRQGLPRASIDCVDADGKQVWRGKTDEYGYAVADIGAPGEYRVRLVGDPTDCPDQEAVVRFGGEGPHDATAVLAASEPATSCSITIDADYHRGARDIPVVLLRRLDPAREIVILVTPDLQPGSTTFELRLPAGDYLPVVLPQGRLDSGEGATPIRIDGRGPVAARLDLSESKQIELELQGIGPTQLPLAVQWVQEDDLFDTAETRIWCGPTTWRRAHAQVGSSPGRVRIVAHGNCGVWMSEQPVSLQGGPVRAAMRPGCRLMVRCDLDQVGKGCVLVARHAFGEVARVLRPALDDTFLGRLPCSHAMLIVPFGEVRLELLDEAGSSLGQRTLNVTRRSQTLSW